MKQIFLIRHADAHLQEDKTEENVKLALSALTDNGLLQAKRIAKRLNSFSIKRLLSSPQQRALETAGYIAKNHLTGIEVRDELNEQYRGPLIGTAKSKDIEHLFPDEWRGWQSGNMDYTPPGGESNSAFLTRVSTMLTEMENCESDTVVAVTHFGFIQGALCQILGLPFRFRLPLEIDNASITHIRSVNSKRILVTLNDVCHLKGLNK